MWHRRLRQQRSRARKALRLGRRLSSTHLSALLHHHATAPGQRRALRLMGKQGRGQGSWQQGGWYPQPSWSASVWQGAKRQWENRQPSLNFPAYDSDWTSGRTEAIAVIEERRFDQEQPKTRTAAVQHALNHARKIDTRLLKLQREQVQKAEQWNAYQQGMKAAYNKEKLRHEKALQRIDSDIAAALEAQEEAQVMVEQAALHFGQAQPRMEVDDTAWDSLMRHGRSPRPPLRTMWQRTFGPTLQSDIRPVLWKPDRQ